MAAWPLAARNGFHRLRLKSGKGRYLLDLVAALNTEAYRIQARAFATGSDGLADLSEHNLLEIVLPEVTNEKTREMLDDHWGTRPAFQLGATPPQPRGC